MLVWCVFGWWWEEAGAAPQQTKERTGEWLSLEGVQGEAEDTTSTKGEWTELGLGQEQKPFGLLWVSPALSTFIQLHLVNEK